MRPRSLPALAAALTLLLIGSSATAQPPSAPPPSATPSSDPLRDFQDQPGTETTPGGLDWQQVDRPTQSRQAQIGDLMTWAGGFLALEHRERRDGTERVPALWSSPDGRTWTRTPLPRLGGNLLDVVPFRGGLALLATDRRVALASGGRAFRITVWRSDDAASWRETGSFGDRVPAGYAAGWQWAHRDALSVNGRLVFIAHLRYSIGMGGWLGAPWAMLGPGGRTGAAEGEEQLVGWTSTDGAFWSSAPVTGIADLPEHTTWAPVGIRALGPRLTESRDGLTWKRVADQPPHYQWGGPDGLLWADGTSLVYGDRDGVGCGNRQSVWRLEADGWVETLDRQAMAVYDGAADRSTVILVGDSWCLPGDDLAEWAWILVSDDGGRTWDPDTSWVGADGTCFSEVAIRDGTAVMLACGTQRFDDPPHPAVWVADLP